MSLFELLILSFFCFFQSIFGVGLLILGTPTFILLGYHYFEVLNILLPYSIIISTLQIIFYIEKNDTNFIKQFCILSLPPLIIGLLITIFYKELINFSLLISIILIIFSLLNLINLKRTIFKIINPNFYLIFMGLLHGLTNLGGSLLTLIVSNRFNKKEFIRYYIAAGYLIFAIIQLSVINLFNQNINLSYLKYLWIPILIFFISQFFFKKINNVIFYIILNVSTLLYGLFIFANSFNFAYVI